MATYTAEQLTEILQRHAKFLNGETDGERANLGGAYLGGANLGGANLGDANLGGAYLRGANLSDANLGGANLSDANLSGANLSDANLGGANLGGANLSGAYLRGANLGGANLSDVAMLPTGETWKQYIEETLPALLTAGGKSVADLVAAGAWDCHSWDNCPMAEAFSCKGISGVPILLRPRAEQFVQLFDAGLLPVELLTAVQA